MRISRRFHCDAEDLQTRTPQMMVKEMLGNWALIREWHIRTDPRTGETEIEVTIEGTDQEVAWWILSTELPVGVDSKY